MPVRSTICLVSSRACLALLLSGLGILPSGCALMGGPASDREVQAAVEKAADDPFPSAKQVGLAMKDSD